MSQVSQFAAVLDAAEQLDIADQAELVAILQRLAERGRERVVARVEEAEREFAAGQSRVMSAKEIVQKALQ